MDLIKELGQDYFSQRFNGCFFLDPDKQVCAVNADYEWQAKQVPIIRFHRGEEVISPEQSSLPYSFFESMQVFAVPPLGWRTAAKGCYLVHFNRNNKSYHRAVAPVNLRKYISPITAFLMNSDNLPNRKSYEQQGVVAHLVMRPEYLKIREGVSAIREGKILTFATSPNIAIIPDVGDRLSVWFNTKEVGYIEADNSISCKLPAVRSMIETSL